MTPSRFEFEHGYTPCIFTLGEGMCPYSGKPDACEKTIEDCRRLGCIEHFGGMQSMDPDVNRAQLAKLMAKLTKTSPAG